MNTLERKTLDTSDRCDRCGAQAYVQVWLNNGLDLMFCVHHHKEHKKILEQVVLTTHDESDRMK